MGYSHHRLLKWFHHQHSCLDYQIEPSIAKPPSVICIQTESSSITGLPIVKRRTQASIQPPDSPPRNETGASISHRSSIEGDVAGDGLSIPQYACKVVVFLNFMQVLNESSAESPAGITNLRVMLFFRSSPFWEWNEYSQQTVLKIFDLLSGRSTLIMCSDDCYPLFGTTYKPVGCLLGHQSRSGHHVNPSTANRFL